MKVLELVHAPIKKVPELFQLPSDDLSVTGRNPYKGTNPVYDLVKDGAGPFLALRVGPKHNGSTQLSINSSPCLFDTEFSSEISKHALQVFSQYNSRGAPRGYPRGNPRDSLGLPQGINQYLIHLLISKLINNLVIESEVK